MMKKRWLSMALSLILAATLAICPALAVSAAELGADIDGAKVVFENPQLTQGDVHGWEGGDASWVTSADGVMTVTVQPGVTGMYYRPNSPYGTHGAFGEGGIAMKLKLDFTEDAAGDWGAMLLIRNTNHLSWDATNALSLYFYKNMVALWQAGVATPLAVVYKPVAGAYYNVEFITDDLDDGTTNVYVLITDENGNLVKNDGDEGKYTMMVEGISTASIPAAFISLYTNSAELASYSMKQGEWTYNQSAADEGGNEVAPPVSSNTYPDLEGVRQYDFTELGVTTQDGLDKYWAPIGNVSYTINDAQTLLTITPSTTEGLYFGPCSPYGGSLASSVAIAMNFGIDFKEGAADWGYMMILKGDQPNPTWALSNGIVMMVYPHAVTLCKMENAVPVVLATYNGTLEAGKNYNVEFIAIDREDNTTDAWLVITDESGKVLSESGDEVTLGVTGITGATGEGWVSMFANGGAVSQYRFGTGTFTTDDDSTPPKTGDLFTVIVALMSISGGAACFLFTRKK